MSAFTPSQDFRDVYTVSRLNREVRTVLEGSFPLLWIEGEISNFSRPASGHWYFSLKDEAAQVRCAMFRNKNLYAAAKPENGMQVLVRARVGLYENRGEFQLVIEHLEEAGDGALRRAFEELKQRLDKEGLFRPERKRAVPFPPRQAGIITSATGAALRDVLTTLQRRFPALPVVVYPVPVQGAGAADEIAAMIRTANRRTECDVLLLVRGGGSLEDLWAFNEEVLARAIAGSEIPIVCGVGHEIDFTIADFAADLRAPTPTAAAETISPDQGAWRQQLQKLQQRIEYGLNSQIRIRQHHLKALRSQLQQPGHKLQRLMQRLDELFVRQQQTIQHQQASRRQQLKHLSKRLEQMQAMQRLKQYHLALGGLLRRLYLSQQHGAQQRRQRLHHLGRAMDTVSPLATLSRGYAIVQTEAGRIVRDAKQLETNQAIRTRLHRGQIISRVEKIETPHEE